MQRHTPWRAVLNGAGVRAASAASGAPGHQRHPAASTPTRAPRRRAPRRRPAPGSAPWSRRAPEPAAHRSAPADFSPQHRELDGLGLDRLGQLIDLAAGPLQLPVSLLGRPAPPSGQRRQRRVLHRAANAYDRGHIDLPLAGRVGPGSSPARSPPRKSPTSSPATAHAAADELRSRSLTTPLRSPQEPARVGSILSTISASNSDAEQTQARVPAPSPTTTTTG